MGVRTGGTKSRVCFFISQISLCGYMENSCRKPCRYSRRFPKKQIALTGAALSWQALCLRPDGSAGNASVNISRHLACLRNAGLIRGERRGKWMYYRLADSTNKPARALFDLPAENLPGLPVINQDHYRLTGYLADKDATHCNEK